MGVWVQLGGRGLKMFARVCTYKPIILKILDLPLLLVYTLNHGV